MALDGLDLGSEFGLTSQEDERSKLARLQQVLLGRPDLGQTASVIPAMMGRSEGGPASLEREASAPPAREPEPYATIPWIRNPQPGPGEPAVPDFIPVGPPRGGRIVDDMLRKPPAAPREPEASVPREIGVER